jgi:hypothetical protein
MGKSSVDVFRRYLSVQSLPTLEQARTPKPAITISRQTGVEALTVANPIFSLSNRRDYNGSDRFY